MNLEYIAECIMSCAGFFLTNLHITLAAIFHYKLRHLLELLEIASKSYYKLKKYFKFSRYHKLRRNIHSFHVTVSSYKTSRTFIYFLNFILVYFSSGEESASRWKSKTRLTSKGIIYCSWISRGIIGYWFLLHFSLLVHCFVNWA